jgi:hypothetical protein
LTVSPLSNRAIELRLSLLYAGTFLTFGVQIPFLPVWLGARGLDDQRIALVLARRSSCVSSRRRLSRVGPTNAAILLACSPLH